MSTTDYDYIHDAHVYDLRIPVFLSSTYFDLQKHREAVQKVAERLRWPWLEWMEGVVAAPAAVLHASLRMIDRSQVFLCLIGKRAGLVLEDQVGRSTIVEREFDHATSLGLCRLVFVADDWDKGPAEDRDLLAAFLAKVRDSVWPGSFRMRSIDDLACQVAIALSHEWNQMNGRMAVVVDRPHADFVRIGKNLHDLRDAIAQDCQIRTHRVWLTMDEEPIPEVTKFTVLLPNFFKREYLRMVSSFRSGGVFFAEDWESGMPMPPDGLISLYHGFRVATRLSSSPAARRDAINQVIAQYRKGQEA